MTLPPGYRRHAKYRLMMTLSQAQFNQNKFYQLDIWTKPKTRKTFLCTRWGRIGAAGQSKTYQLPTLDHAVKRFQKTRMNKMKKGYVRVKTSARKVLRRQKAAALAGTLPPTVKRLVKRIFDECKSWTQKRLQIKYKDAEIVTPLGTLHAEQVQAGQAVLHLLRLRIVDRDRKLQEELLQQAWAATAEDVLVHDGILFAGLRNRQGQWLNASLPVHSGMQLVNRDGRFQVVVQRNTPEKADAHAVAKLSNEYFSLIPHKFGHKKPPVLDTLEAIRNETQLLQQLEDLNQLLVRDSQALRTKDVKRQYASLECTMAVVDPETDEFQAMQAKVAPHKLRQLFRVRKESEHQAFRKDPHNTPLLFHGSRMHNWLGLLSKGLLLPKQVEATGVALTDGGWLGRGLYFGDADTAAKYASTGGGKTAFILAAEVAMGRVYQTIKRDYSLTEAPAGYDSVHGVKDAAGAGIIDRLTGLLGVQKEKSQFHEDEYVIYRTEQQRMTHLLEIEGKTGSYASNT